uniref:Symplekin n=1 Tax=Kwoniella bestiolae CBS 10118 TaxID=1296100 RepID=A0A1B9GCP9_9TREE|nr:symplekin [Kwoniella bestiolae CBS 10118]OCF28795.1 symplekin [Kwoniella bestiolae CBS 10118]
MSLYSEDDLGGYFLPDDNNPGAAGSSSASASTSGDPLHTLTSALALPSESTAQQEGLNDAARKFEENPSKLPELVPQLLGLISDGEDSMLRFWTLDMIALAVGRSGLKLDVKLGVAQQCLEALCKLLSSNSISTIKAVIPIFSTIYPLLFRLLATSRPQPEIVEMFNTSKMRILNFALDPNSQPNNVGIRAVAWKFLQKVVLAGTRAAGADPRATTNPNDVNFTMIQPDCALNVNEVEEEGSALLTQLVTHLYSLSDPTLLHPIINTLPILCKSRPLIADALISSMTLWTPSALGAAGRQPMEIRAVEKTMRVVMTHLLRHPPFSNFSARLNEALLRQKQRMEHAFATEASMRRERRKAKTPGKHPMEVSENEAESSEQAQKRARLQVDLGIRPGTGRGKGLEVDVGDLPVESVIEAVMQGLEIVPLELLNGAFENARRAIIEGTPDAIPLLASVLGVGVTKVEPKEEDVDEILNPLDMDLDDDDLLLEGDDEIPQEDEDMPLTFSSFTLPQPEPLDPEDKSYVLSTALQRIWTTGADLSTLPDAQEEVQTDAIKLAVKPKEMWMLLLARLATRVNGENDRERRKAVADFVVEDFVNRSKFASIWLNEEWYTSKVSSSPTDSYTDNLISILTAYLPKIDAKDKTLFAFVSDLPEIPPQLIQLLEDLCQDTDRNLVGFLALRDIVETRPPARQLALETLLGLCTHPERRVRVPAIITTVRKWGPDSPMMPKLVDFALGVLWRLKSGRKEDGNKAEGDEVKIEDEDVTMEDDNLDIPKPVSSKFLPIPFDITSETVQQHVELCFALTKRNQQLLDSIFTLYPSLPSSEIQDALEAQLIPLIQSLGPTEKLLDILRSYRKGTEGLSMRIIGILTQSGSSPALVGVVKSLLDEHEVEGKFVASVVGDLDKAEIEKQLPRIVSLLANPDDKDLVRTAFASMLGKMTPADLMVAIHRDEQSQLKFTIEAIGICFSMTTVFRSDVLANSMSRIADLPTQLPVVFLRTIIQVVTTYKSLIPFVANHILPKLIAKKIWKIKAIWEGFIRLVKLISPASFGSLLQLPKEQLKEVVQKQPSLKNGLKGFVMNKPGGNKQVLAEIFGEEEPAQTQ